MHATPKKADPKYDPARHIAVLPLLLHHDDGTCRETDLELNPDQLEALHIMLGQLIDKRREALQSAL